MRNGPILLIALGRATIAGGHVDCFPRRAAHVGVPSPSLAAAARFGSIEEETNCRFVASEHALAGNPLQSEEEWLMESDDTKH